MLLAGSNKVLAGVFCGGCAAHSDIPLDIPGDGPNREIELHQN